MNETPMQFSMNRGAARKQMTASFMNLHIQNLFLMLALLAGMHQAAAQVLTNIVVNPANPTIALGSNQQFTATGYYNNGSSQVLTNGGNGNWVAVAGMPTAKSGAACAAVNGSLYVVSGPYLDRLVYAYDPTSNLWSTKASLPDDYGYAGAAGIGNKFYFIGGCRHSDCASQPGSEVYIYDAVTNSWSSGAAMGTARSGMGVGVINGKIYAAGGASSGYASQNLLQIYNPTNNTWTSAHAMPAARSNCGATAMNGKLYVVGGYDTGTSGTYGSLFVYDPATDSWTTNAPMPTARYAVGVTTVGGLLYAMGGITASGVATNLVEVYNPVTDSWSTGAPTLTGHYELQPVVINGTIYLAGNGPQNNAITNAESYTPQNSLWSSSSPTVASINTNGVATGLTNGVTTITATSGSVSSNAALTVVTPPVITLQPTNNTVSPNGSVTLSVAATGGGLSYQWRLNGTNIAGAVSASFTITNVTPTDIGVYTVIVNNAAGSVTSLAGTLASVDIKMYAGIIVNGPLGSNYLIQATLNFTNVNWTTLTNLALPTQPYIYIDYGSPTNSRQFYRAVPQ